MRSGPAQPAVIDGSSPRAGGLRFQAGNGAAAGAPPVGLCDVRMTLTARADQVVLVRQVVGAIAQSLGFVESKIEDVRLAVTEACTNVVRHAYRDGAGHMEVAASAEAGGLTVIVADHGCGLRPRIENRLGGLGLPLMAALAASVEFAETDGRGTTVRLSFARAQ